MQTHAHKGKQRGGGGWGRDRERGEVRESKELIDNDSENVRVGSRRRNGTKEQQAQITLHLLPAHTPTQALPAAFSVSSPTLERTLLNSFFFSA
jgi:hypothetical protein